MATYNRYLLMTLNICSSYFSQINETSKNLADLPMKEMIIKNNKL